MTSGLFLMELALKSSLILLTGFALARMLARASAATRHVVWGLLLASLIVLPFLSLTVPKLDVPTPQALQSYPIAPFAAPSELPPQRSLDVIRFVWFGGILLALLRLLHGLRKVQRMVHTGRPVAEESWKKLLADLSLETPVALLETDRTLAPMAWTLPRAAILLPIQARDWPLERRRVVLLHELAHLKRRDCLTQLLARLVCCVYWFQPLAWLAARRFALEQERACDDMVLAHGTVPSDYAGHLLEVARAMGSRERHGMAALAMARRSQLEGRLLAILDRGLRRRVHRLTAIATGLALFALVLAVSAARPGAASGPAGGLSGTIYDGTGVVPGATVIVRNSLSGAERKTASGQTGHYSLPDLPAGRYQLEVQVPGFAVYQSGNLNLHAGSVQREDVVLRLGTIRERVEVVERGVPRPASSGPRRIRVGGNVQATRLLHTRRPRYPPEAREQGVEGVVVLHAIIRRDGELGEVRLLSSSHPALAAAAQESLSGWRYQPTLLNGEPVEVETTISIHFRLAQ
ncbi:MAG: M56 family metallopeptidase [Bryobacteraceae bacterium]